jgi:RimJ/RimL family protein N-acetyltransferase
MLKGSKVTLRPIKRADIPYFLLWFNDPQVTRYLAHNAPMTEMDEEKWVEGLAGDSSRVNLAIEAVTPDGSVFIGTTGFHQIEARNRQAVFGIVIGNREYWSNGYGTEAAGLLVDYGFSHLNLHRLNSSVYDFNPRSQKMHLKLGFKEEGRRRQSVYVEGQYHDIIEYGLLRSEWYALQPKG